MKFLLIVLVFFPFTIFASETLVYEKNGYSNVTLRVSENKNNIFYSDRIHKDRNYIITSRQSSSYPGAPIYKYKLGNDNYSYLIYMRETILLVSDGQQLLLNRKVLCE